MIAMPDPTTFAVLPWRPEEQGVGARCSATSCTPERTPYEGDPRHVLRRALERAEGDGLRHLQRRPRARVLPVQATSNGTEVLDEGGYFDLTTLDAGSDVRRETVLALEQLGIHVEYSHHEVGPSPARDRHALRRRAEDGRRLHDLPHHGQGVRDEVRLARDVHAQAAVRRERLGHAHAPVALQGRAQRVLRRRRPVLPVRRRQGVHRRPARTRARSARSSPSGSTPTSGWCPATRRRSTSPGRAATARRSCACRSTTRARSRRRAWSCAARTRRATRT